jgi:hypothetical protein
MRRAEIVPLAFSIALSSMGCFSDDVIARLRDASAAPSVQDSAPPETSIPTDAPNVADVSDALDASDAPEACPGDVILDANTVALYDFENVVGTTVPDRTGRHTGELRGAAVLEPGPAACGSALQIRNDSYVYIAPDPAWQLSEGSVDFWVKLPNPLPGTTMAIISRDAHFTTGGDFTVYVAADGTIAARLQRGQATAVRCSTQPVPPGKWTKVGFNFGPQGTALYVDGAQGAGTKFLDFIMAPCGTDATGGLTGNDYEFVIGASLDRADAASVEGLTFFLNGGAVDDVRISSVRRAF